MAEERRLHVPPDLLPARLDRFLAENLPELTRSQLKNLIDDGAVLLAGKPAKAGERLKGGETIVVALPTPRPAVAEAEAIPLNIVYEDRHLLVVDKPAGLVVHPAPGHAGGTLVNALLHHCHDLAGIGGELRPGIVHRIDKDTSGLLVVTKDDASHLHLARQFKAHSINRRYLALVYGLAPSARGTISSNIGRHPQQRQKMSSTARIGRHAVTHWRVQQQFADERLSLLELALETGRTHQIRVHLSERNLPIVGDPVYGQRGRANNLVDPELRRLVAALDRQALHARLLGFIHPAEERYLEFESPLPADMATIVNYLATRHPGATAP